MEEIIEEFNNAKEITDYLIKNSSCNEKVPIGNKQEFTKEDSY